MRIEKDSILRPSELISTITGDNALEKKDSEVKSQTNGDHSVKKKDFKTEMAKGAFDMEGKVPDSDNPTQSFEIVFSRWI